MSFETIQKEIDDGYERKRSVEEFIGWVDHCFESLRNQCSSEEFHRSRVIKRLREEAFPLRIYLDENPDSLINVQLKDGSQNYDGTAQSKDAEFYLEFTCVKDGQFDLYQAKHLDKFGSASASGVDTNSLNSAIRDNQQSIGEAVYANAEIESVAKRTFEEIGKKVEKTYNENTILIVAIDSVSTGDDDNWALFCINMLNTKIVSKFHSIYVVCYVSKNILKLNM